MSASPQPAGSGGFETREVTVALISMAIVATAFFFGIAMGPEGAAGQGSRAQAVNAPHK